MGSQKGSRGGSTGGSVKAIRPLSPIRKPLAAKEPLGIKGSPRMKPKLGKRSKGSPRPSGDDRQDDSAFRIGTVKDAVVVVGGGGRDGQYAADILQQASLSDEDVSEGVRGPGPDLGRPR